MKKRQRKKTEKNQFKELLEECGGEIYDFFKDHRKLEKVSTEEDLRILFGVLDNEFDDAPHRKFLAEHILYDYAWWFILEKYLVAKKILFQKEKREDALTYTFDGNTIGINEKGESIVEIGTNLGHILHLMLENKGYYTKRAS